MKAFIFDLDGVLVFTDRFHYLAWKEIAEELGIFFDESTNNQLRGVSRADSLEMILEKYQGESLSAEKKEHLLEKKNNIYKKYLESMKPESVSPLVRQTLKELKNRGHKLAIGSSSKNTRYILHKVNLEGMFDAISDGTNISRSKPDPEVFLKAAEYLNEKPENCVVVEDARSGIDAAKAAGMMAVGIGDVADYEKTDVGIGQMWELLELV